VIVLCFISAFPRHRRGCYPLLASAGCATKQPEGSFYSGGRLHACPRPEDYAPPVFINAGSPPGELLSGDGPGNPPRPDDKRSLRYR